MAISVILNTSKTSTIRPEVIDALRGFRQIIVADSSLSPEALEDARRLGCRIVETPDQTSLDDMSKVNYLMQEVVSQWVLFVDPDEVVPADLIDYLHDFTTNPGDVRGLYIPRKNFIYTKWKKTSYPDYRLRFVHRDCASWPEDRKMPVVNGVVSKIPASSQHLALLHKSSEISLTVDQLKTTPAASHGKVSLFSIVWHPIATFWAAYIGKGNFRYGTEGYIVSLNQAMRKYISMIKLYEADHKAPSHH